MRSIGTWEVKASECRVNASECILNASECRVNASECRVNTSECRWMRVNANECEWMRSECALNATPLYVHRKRLVGPPSGPPEITNIRHSPWNLKTNGICSKRFFANDITLNYSKKNVFKIYPQPKKDLWDSPHVARCTECGVRPAPAARPMATRRRPGKSMICGAGGGGLRAVAPPNAGRRASAAPEGRCPATERPPRRKLTTFLKSEQVWYKSSIFFFWCAIRCWSGSDRPVCTMYGLPVTRQVS